MVTKIAENRKIRYHYHIQATYLAGIILLGSEIKSIRNKQVDLSGAFCFFLNNELWLKNFYIKEFQNAHQFNHDPLRQRKLLLKNKELKKIKVFVDLKGNTLLLSKVIIDEKGLAKIELALCSHKNMSDKREQLKEKESKQQLSRLMKLKRTNFK